MARARNLKPGFFKNENLAECQPLTRILFAGLWCEADRAGRIEYRPKKLKAEILPYDDANVVDMLAELAKWGFILVYEVKGAKFIQVLNFSKHQNPHVKEAESVIPAPESPVSASDAPESGSGGAPDKPGASPVQVSDKALPLPALARLIPSSLIPSSLIPHPDTGSLIPDSPIPEEATASAPAAPVRRQPVAVPSENAGTWVAYTEAYRTRYGAEPVRNATVNGQMAQFVKRLGVSEAPEVARFYVGLSTAWYVTKGHPVGLLVNDAEKLRTEWATGKTINGTSARRQEATAANPFLELLRDGTHG